jgi:FlaA1/EpsC-like NDP-sugar epimerase
MLHSFTHNTMTTIKVFDLAAVCVSFLVSFAITSGSFTWPDFADVLVIKIKIVNLVLFVGYLLLCSGVFSVCGFYRSHRLSHWHQRLSEILLAVTFVTGVLLVLKWLFRVSLATHEFLLLYWFLTFCELLLYHEVVQWLLHLARLRGRTLHNVIIIGEGPDAAALADRVQQETNLGYQVLRIIDVKETMENARIAADN